MTQFLNFLLSYYASTLFPAVNPQPRAVKRQRLMTSPQARNGGIISPQNQVVIQSPQAQQQQQIVAANKLTSAANSLLQLQQQQQMLLANAAPVVNLCNSMPTQPLNFINNNNISNNNNFKMCNGDNNDTVSQQSSTAGPFKVYSELSHQSKLFFC
jgi:hypothetical protein